MVNAHTLAHRPEDSSEGQDLKTAEWTNDGRIADYRTTQPSTRLVQTRPDRPVVHHGSIDGPNQLLPLSTAFSRHYNFAHIHRYITDADFRNIGSRKPGNGAAARETPDSAVWGTIAYVSH